MNASRFIRRVAGAVSLTGIAGLVACASAPAVGGSGAGRLSGSGADGAPALISWVGDTPLADRGHLVVTVPRGTFEGRFVQVSLSTPRDAIAPLWQGWSEGWLDWPLGGVSTPGDSTERFLRDYDGATVANLRAEDGRVMRCRVSLDWPARGLSGGGRTRCQVKDGPAVDATLPAFG